ncbi:Uu.00g030460.m01.CDS01 [Anthostomella pinea]|uniref:Uu.00g030460.m01.CDS01 n=1 Tax=Anthostomella pinea TaxID=933095 RepID=A0AAI8YD44_9PEZI|nr:Uu.00g030460.m01.CDS01 [Anthostomella pinea]
MDPSADRHQHSTLEVDTEKQHYDKYPEVDIQMQSLNNYPEVAVSYYPEVYQHQTAYTIRKEQLSNKAIYMSAWDSSHGEWVVSPVVDGTTVSLDDVSEGTLIGMDITRIQDNKRTVHLYWTSPDPRAKSLVGPDIPIHRLSTVDEWQGTSANELQPDRGLQPLLPFRRGRSGAGGIRRRSPDTTLSTKTLGRNISAETSITAFATGISAPNNSAPLRFQVLTVDPLAKDGVHLTYYDTNFSELNSEVLDLSDCAPLASMAVNRGLRVYCLVENTRGVGIEEFEWRGDVSDFTLYNRIGTVGTV